jgi:hypothetical protein
METPARAATSLMVARLESDPGSVRGKGLLHPVVHLVSG